MGPDGGLVARVGLAEAGVDEVDVVDDAVIVQVEAGEVEAVEGQLGEGLVDGDGEQGVLAAAADVVLAGGGKGHDGAHHEGGLELAVRDLEVVVAGRQLDVLVDEVGLVEPVVVVGLGVVHGELGVLVLEQHDEELALAQAGELAAAVGLAELGVLGQRGDGGAGEVGVLLGAEQVDCLGAHGQPGAAALGHAPVAQGVLFHLSLIHI